MQHIVVKAYTGLVFLVLCLALALFVAAGSLVFWQAWVFLAVWTVCTVLITAYLVAFDQDLLARRTQAGPAAETQKVQQIVQLLAGLCFLGMFVVAGLDARLHWSHVPAWLSWGANSVVVLGFIMIWRVFKTNSYTSATIEVANEQRVIDTGPYRLVRHPMYTGATLLLLATPLALGSWYTLPLPILLIAIVIVRLLAEERFLRAQLVGYAAYCQRVRYHLIPYIW